MANWERPQSPDLNCHVCRYDLRAHADADVCPECGTAVSQSREVALVPIRPAWRDSDPRWRRRMLLGVWLIVLMPAMRVLHEFEITQHIPVPSVLGSVRSLSDTYFGEGGVFGLVAFTTGIAMLFSPERGRRSTTLDRAYRWGILGCYFVMLLYFVLMLVLPMLIVNSIAAMLMSIPTQSQPEMTGVLATVTSTYVRFGPMEYEWSEMLLVTCSTVLVILACAPVVAALRSAGARFWAYIIIAPVVGLAIRQLVRVVMVVLDGAVTVDSLLSFHSLFFGTWAFAVGLEALTGRGFHDFSRLHSLYPPWSRSFFFVEAVKWGVFLVIAVWLTIAQIRARSAKSGSTASP